MTGGLLSVSIMRPDHCWTVLHVSILAVLFITLNADNEDSNCSEQIIVRRNTVHEAVVGQELRINCTVAFCSRPPPLVTWSHFGETSVPINSSNDRIKTEWRMINLMEGISYLIFQNILKSDSGRYQCRTNSSPSHAITVSVHDNSNLTNGTQENDSKSKGAVSERKEKVWLYVYSAAGIATFVIIVIIISVISMRGCKGKSKKETQTENQYMAIPMAEQPFPHASPRGSPSVSPSRSSSQRKTPLRQPNKLTLSRDNEQNYGQTKEDRKRQRNTMEEEGSSVVYAALNHQVPPRDAARPRRLKEETSEYAAIRVA